MSALVRAAAVGALFGICGIVAIVERTPELLAPPVAAALFAGPTLLFHAALFLAAGVALTALGALAARLGAPRSAFASRRFWWALLALVLAFVALQELRYRSEWLDAWRGPLRTLVGLGGLALVADTLLRPRATALLRSERALAALLVPAALLTAGYLWPAGGTPDVAAGPPRALGLAPRFAPEPEGTLRPATSRPRVMVVGLDGASWARIEPLVAQGRLPTFTRLMEGGFRSELVSEKPTYSPRLWTTMMTGVPPELHGIDAFYLWQLPRIGIHDFRMPRALDLFEEFLTWSQELVRIPVTSTLRRRKALWNLADEAGLRSAVVGLWATWPPEPLAHGTVVSDHASLAKRHEWLDRRKTSRLTAGVTTFPPELEAELADLQRRPDSVTRAELARFVRVDDATWAEFQRADRFSKAVKLSAFRSSHLNDAFYLAAAARLWDTRTPELLVVYAKAIDELSHFFYKAGVPEAATFGYSEADAARYGEVVDRIYEWTDERLAPLVAAVDRDPDALLILVSDHGWGREADGNYDHNDAPPGIFLAYGAGVCATCVLAELPTIYDVGPTVLERLGLPLSAEFPGRPLPVFTTRHPVETVVAYGPPTGPGVAVASELDPALLEKLRALGYVN